MTCAWCRKFDADFDGLCPSCAGAETARRVTVPPVGWIERMQSETVAADAAEED